MTSRISDHSSDGVFDLLEHEISEFQIRTTANLLLSMQLAGKECRIFFHIGVSENYFIVHSGEYKIYIYADGTNIQGENVDERFEADDYSNLADLENAFIKSATNLIGGA